MRFNLVSIFVVYFIMSIASLQAQESYKANLVTESLLLDITQAGEQLVAVGERGHIIRSPDGVKWAQDSVPSIATLTAISFIGSKGWAVGHDATILHTSGNNEWQVQMFEPEFERPFLDVAFLNENHGIAIGAYGTFYRTQDSGVTWTSEMHPEFLSQDDQEYLEEVKLEDEEFYLEELASILPHLNRIRLVDDTLYIAGEAGLIAKSTDEGRSWERLPIDYYGSFFDIYQDDSNALFAAGLRGNLFRHNEQSDDWNKIDSSSTASLNSVLSLKDNSLLIVGNNGTLVCVRQDMVKQTQTPDSQAITNAILFNNQIVAVTTSGIQVLSDFQDDRLCNKDKS